MKAKEHFDRIGYGHKNALQRPSKSWEDRALRLLVGIANMKDDCIINVGQGYYRPVPGDPVDEAELNHYLNSELSRARKILLKRLSMRRTFERWRESEVFSRYTREA